jgi:cytoskeleton protein RodZ
MLSEGEQKAASTVNADIGSALRDARTIAGITLEDVARRTRISKSFLEFIELNQFDKLPGVGYTPGFIRNYCTAISVDPAPYIEVFKTSLTETEAKPEYKFHVQALVPKMAGSVVAMIVVAVVLSGYVGWTLIDFEEISDPVIVAQSSLMPADEVAQKLGEQQMALVPVASIIDDSAAPIAGAPENVAKETLYLEEQTAESDATIPVEMPVQDEVAQAETPVVIPQPLLSEAKTDTTATIDTNLALQSIAESQDSMVNTPVAAAGAQATARRLSSELIIKATSTSWVEIVRADGEVSVSKLMRSGDSLVATIGKNLFLSTGNAGGLTLQTSTIEPFSAGNVGEILRDLPLNFDAIVSRRDLSTY